jgi:hypothetical protein
MSEPGLAREQWRGAAALARREVGPAKLRERFPAAALGAVDRRVVCG